MPIQVNDETYYSVNEALAYLGIARDTLYRRVKEGRLQKYTYGAKNRVYFRFTELSALKELHPVPADNKREEEKSRVESPNGET